MQQQHSGSHLREHLFAGVEVLVAFPEQRCVVGRKEIEAAKGMLRPFAATVSGLRNRLRLAAADVEHLRLPPPPRCENRDGRSSNTAARAGTAPTSVSQMLSGRIRLHATAAS